MASNKISPVKSSQAGPSKTVFKEIHPVKLPPKEDHKAVFNRVHPVKSGETGVFPKEKLFNRVNKNRRNLLKFLLIGGGALLLGKFLSPKFLEFFSDATTENNFVGFQVVQKGKELTIYDRTGEAIFIIDDKKE
ncbi:MAG: hypothetical protein A3B89_03700 [Candidatus Buchananbacteria bacterium RIFCSPHIGHO2_02_FULL_40_13]|uniref:Uncharacterized protein n=1 Tax=Candidatus Buchananbacteria bacterium RIFCSPLOWO2_01_FULL_39_33 TaxID=1797543 RepID=A0A1G1YJ88_9BACT|nr:MAG: hypothetical protein A2820_01725 [Candidatus Buchananbacteria bacterium RIFCSPHIGHO2_01_FULL_40_35]OGY50308.1 MAG: hypothetical protein A3B89_03700 [Candidatus Buchananbacteria bacterium RIFCSPHIGHO2_02_FULL_40_13]OGY52341.1 MAG: hypothetical protein A3A02_04735 [Candidatus Buchananbacteria bacterium RIFCSPLOWO2_01_FULL_39_33]